MPAVQNRAKGSISIVCPFAGLLWWQTTSFLSRRSIIASFPGRQPQQITCVPVPQSACLTVICQGRLLVAGNEI